MQLNRSNVVKMMNSLEMLGFIKTNGTSCRFTAITTRTPVVKIRAGNPWGAGAKTESGLYKVSRKIGIINVHWCAAVERRIAEKLGVPAKEVEYVAGDVWYEHLMTSDDKALPVVQHKDEAKRNGEFYLQYFTHKSENYYVNEAGEVVPDATVKPWLYAAPERSDFKPSVISVKLSNIQQLKLSGIVIEMPELNEVESLFAD